MSHSGNVDRQIQQFRDDFAAIQGEIAKVFVGHDDAVRALLTAVVAGGHTLIEGPPGVGKTFLAESLARTLNLALHRIQFTPDLTPSDVVGTYVILETAQGRKAFEFHEGPIFANLVLADQINRGTPKSQAALLEAMESGRVSVGGETFPLPQPFLVVATQNGLESEGTFPLPDAQLDRFFVHLRLPFPSVEQMDVILTRAEGTAPELRPIVGAQRLLEMRDLAHGVPCDVQLRRWLIGLAAASHPQGAGATASVRRYVRYGVGPRGLQAALLAARIAALAAGRDEVAAADLLAVLAPAWRHRLVLNYDGQAEQIAADDLLAELVRAQPAARSASAEA